MGIVGQPIQDGIGHQRIFKEVHPFLHMATARQNRGRGCIAFDDHFVKIVRLFGSQFLEAEVIHNEKRGTDQSEQFFSEGVIGPTLKQSFEQQSGSDHQDLDASPAGAMAQGIGEVGFAHSDRAAQENVFVSFDETEAEEVFDLFLIQRNGSLPVEAFKGLVGLD